MITARREEAFAMWGTMAAPTTLRLRMLGLIVSSATAFALGCDKPDATGPILNRPSFSHQFYDDVPGAGGTVCGTNIAGTTLEYEDGELDLGPPCQTSIGVSPSDKGLHVEAGAYEPVAVAFSRPVSDLVISTSGGVVHCGDPFGSVTAHRISGEEVTVALEEYPKPPGYCGYEWFDGMYQRTQTSLTFLKATVPDGASIDRVVITPPGGGREWDECGTDTTYTPPRTDCWTLHAVLNYVVLFREFATDLDDGISITCTGSGQLRGSVVSCQAQPQPPTGALSVTGWTFTSDSGDVVPRETSISDLTWAGQLVTNGRLVVTGTIDGQPGTGTASVTVTPRDWSTKTVRSNHTTPGADGLPIHPIADSSLGQSSLDMEVRPDVGNYAVVIADGGPNNGFTYMTDIPFETFTIARVNYPAMAQGSDWYLLQYPKDKHVGGTTYCGQARVLTLPPLVEAHEGTNPANQPDSHVGIYINDVTRDSRVLTEGIARLDPKVGPVLTQIHNAAQADSRAMDGDSRNHLILPCIFRYFSP